MIGPLLGLAGYAYGFANLLRMSAFNVNLAHHFPVVAAFLPETIDGPASNPLNASPYLINSLLSVSFFAAHSLLARPFVKEFASSWSLYRAFYVALAGLQVGMISKFWQPIMDDKVLYSIDPTTALVGNLCGFLFLATATFAIDHFELFGLNQAFNMNISESLKILPISESRFKTRWHYSLVRHPLMTGFMIMLTCVPTMTYNHALFSTAMLSYIVLAVSLLEEPDLVKEVGGDYEKYQKTIPMFCPFFANAQKS